jgi:uncharacterized protein (DUF362 family)
MISRRSAVASAAAVIGSGCRPRRVAVSEARVSILQAPAYDARVYGTIRRVIQEHKLDLRGKRVVLKPNLVEFDAGTVVNTNPVVVHATYEAVRAGGAADIRIAEGPGHRRITLDLADAAGYYGSVPKFEDAFVDLNIDEVSLKRLGSNHSGLKQLYLPNTVLGCDLLISLPKMKTHHWVGATLSMKNLFGVVPGSVYGWPKNVLHWAGIDDCIADLYHTFPAVFAIVDGIDAMEGNGPIQGTLKHAGVIVAGGHLPSVDATCCRLMGIDAGKIGYLNLVAQAASVRQIGENVEQFKTRFQLPPNFGHIGAA